MCRGGNRREEEEGGVWADMVCFGVYVGGR